MLLFYWIELIYETYQAKENFQILLIFFSSLVNYVDIFKQFGEFWPFSSCLAIFLTFLGFFHQSRALRFHCAPTIMLSWCTELGPSHIAQDPPPKKKFLAQSRAGHIWHNVYFPSLGGLCHNWAHKTLSLDSAGKFPAYCLHSGRLTAWLNACAPLSMLMHQTWHINVPSLTELHQTRCIRNCTKFIVSALEKDSRTFFCITIFFRCFQPK